MQGLIYPMYRAVTFPGLSIFYGRGGTRASIKCLESGMQSTTATSDPVLCRMPTISSPFAFFIVTRSSVMVADWDPAAASDTSGVRCLLTGVLLVRAAGLDDV